MPTRKFELHVGPTGKSGRVFLDGEEVTNCRSVSVRTAVGEVTAVTLELINVDVTVSADVDCAELQLVDVTPLSADNRAYRKA